MRKPIFSLLLLFPGLAWAAPAERSASPPQPIAVQAPALPAAVLERLPRTAVELRSGDKVSPFAPAPALTEVRIVQVSSQNGGVEPISEWQQQTVKAHGGANYHVFVFEQGYGESYATMNGRSLPTSTDTGLCPDGYGKWRLCHNGEPIQAWVKDWNLTGYAGGSFETWSLSINGPGVVLRDRLSIR